MDTFHNKLSREIRRAIKNASALIRSAKKGVVLTGAGISTPSGIPDFRTPGEGLWSKFNPMEVASLSAFRYQPEKFLDWFHPLAIKIFHALPNPAHQALADMESAGYLQAIITQNIDGLHQQAGSNYVLEVHGTLQTLSCIGCFTNFPSDSFISPYIERQEIPRCTECGQILKPDIILFEEQLPKQTWLEALEACRNCQFFLVAGSSLEVTPVATLPLEALNNSAKLILINHLPTYLDVRADVLLRGDVADILPQITREVLDG
jgi:NAD-dependent deacetylase